MSCSKANILYFYFHYAPVLLVEYSELQFSAVSVIVSYVCSESYTLGRLVQSGRVVRFSIHISVFFSLFCYITEGVSKSWFAA